MGKLNIIAIPSWAGASNNYKMAPVMVTLSITDDNGEPVPSLGQSAISIRYIEDPEHGSFSAKMEEFKEHRAARPAGAGFYSFVVTPSEEIGLNFGLDQETLLITVRSGGNHGHTACLATFHQNISLPPVNTSNHGGRGGDAGA